MSETSYPVVFVTRTLLDETAALLASFAEPVDREGVVYWFGLELESRAVVTTLVVPDAESDEDRIHTSAAANAAAIAAIAETPLVLLGQAHSHPRDNVRHSRVDDRDTFACFDGALSIVVPFYGRRGLELGQCGVYRHMAGEFMAIPRCDHARHLQQWPGTVDLRRSNRGAVLPSPAKAVSPGRRDKGGCHVR